MQQLGGVLTLVNEHKLYAVCTLVDCRAINRLIAQHIT